MSYRYYLDSDRAFHRYFANLRGVHFSDAPSEVSEKHLTDLENMWHDPRAATDALESHPGYRIFANLPAPIYGIWRHRTGGIDYAVVHAKDKLYRFPLSERNHPKNLKARTPIAHDVAEEKGCGFPNGDLFFLLIGGKYYRISPDGTIGILGDDACKPYVPLTYYNAEPYEQRNLLTDEVRHVFTADGDYLLDEMPEDCLRFSVYNKEDKTAIVSVSEYHRSACIVKVPQTCEIDGEIYTVAAVASGAFYDMRSLVSVTLPDTVTILGAQAFWGCTALLSLSIPKSVTLIGIECFYGCMGLSRLFMPKGVLRIGKDAFRHCLWLDTLLYEGTGEEFDAINMEGENTLRDAVGTVNYGASPFEVFAGLYRYPVCDPAVRILSVKADTDTIDDSHIIIENTLLRYRTVTDGGLITHIELITSDRNFLTGKKLYVHLQASPSVFSAPKGYTPFGNTDSSLSGVQAICGCRAAAQYDSRIFLTANPALPNTVFHTLPDESGLNNPFYIGNLSYFNDGCTNTPNRALLGTGSALMVFKGENDGGGAVYYHTAQSTGISFIPRIYPASSGVEGVGALGGAVNFKDDPVFLGRDGLFGIEKQTVNLERSLAMRSFPVNRRLCAENIPNASMAVHEGLLYLLTEGHVYIADSARYTYRKDGTQGYEWYYLSGIGSYKNDTPLYRRTSFLPQSAESTDVTLHPHAETEATGTVFSMTSEDGTLLYYEKDENGKKYAVDTDGERTGGVFSPATVLCAFENALIFGTQDGSLGCMNTDKRGKRLYRLDASDLCVLQNGIYHALTARPYAVSEDALLTLPLYEKNGDTYTKSGEAKIFADGNEFSLATPFDEIVYPNEVHRYFYSHAGHAYTAACTLAPDDGSAPHYLKDSVPLSAAVKVKTARGGAFSVLVRTDKTPFRLCETLAAGRADFGDFSFSFTDFHEDEFSTVPLAEREKGWCYKQYRFAAHGVRQPFGIIALSYSYRTAGYLKHRF